MKYFKSKRGKRVVCSPTNPNPKAFEEVTKEVYDAEIQKREYRLEILKLKSELAKTDYVVIKIAEAESAETQAALRTEYATVLARRQHVRARINNLEQLI